MKDETQKEIISKHFGARHWFVETEVPVFYKGGVLEEDKPITDVDVLALRPGPDLKWEAVLADCKTLKGVSPVNRVVWLAGLMRHFSASRGLIILRRRQPIEPDHKLFAASLGITLLDEEQFPAYDRAVIYPDGSSQFPFLLAELTTLKDLQSKFPGLKPVTDYMYAQAWNEPTYVNLMRKVLGHAQPASREIDPARQDHLALTLEIAAVFAVGLAECVGTIFTHYLQPSTRSELDDALKVVIWGGRSQYNFIAKLRLEVLEAKNITPSEPSGLALPAWPSFIQLIRSMLEAPSLAFGAPQILRRAAFDVLSGRPFLANATKQELLTVKFAMLTYEYFADASSLPKAAKERIVDEFVSVQSRLALQNPESNSPPHFQPGT